MLRTQSSRKSMLGGIKWATASNIVGQVLNAAVTFVLAALLTPAQFGVVALAYIYIAFTNMVVGFGFNAALIQRKDLRNIHLNSVFWLNMVAGMAFTGVAILCSGWWAHVNHTPSLQAIVIALSAFIPLHGLSSVQIAVLQKKMDFKSLAIRDNVAAALGGATGIILATMGFGAWALVGQHLVRELISMVLLWRLSDWRPSRNFSWRAIKDLMDYAWKAFTGHIGVFAQGNTDGLLIGVLLGPNALGLYRLAIRLEEMTLTFLPRAVQLVSLSHFARLQKDLPELNRSFLFGTHLNCIVTLPAMAFLAGASPLLLKAIGHQWLDATRVLQIIALVGVSKVMILLVGPLLQALSKPGIQSINVWLLATTNALAVCIAAWVFSQFTQEQQISLVAALRALVFLGFFSPLMLWQARRASGVSLKALFKTIGPAIILSLIIGGSQTLLIESGVWAFMSNRYATLFMSAALAGLTWLVGFRMLDSRAWRYLWKEIGIGSGWLGFFSWKTNRLRSYKGK